MALAATYLFQSTAQAVTTHIETKNSWFFEQVNKVRSVVYAINLGTIFTGIKKLVDSLEPWLGFYANVADYAHVYFASGLIMAGAWPLTARKITRWINNYSRPQVDLESNIAGLSAQERAHIHVSWDNPSYKVWMQTFHLTQIVMSVALVFFSETPYPYAASAALQLYSMLKTCGWKWIRVDREFVEPPMQHYEQEGPLSFNFSYYFAVLPPSRPELCGVCLEQEANALWHGKHSLCLPCTIGHIAVSSGNIHDHLHGDSVRSIHRTNRGQFENIESEYMAHQIQIPSRAIPRCPLCREQPSQNHMEISVKYRYRSEREDHSMLQDTELATLTILPEAPQH